MTERLLTALLGVIAMQAAPGPNFAAVASVALGQGRRAALWVVAGVASGMMVWAAAMALGLGALLVAAPALLPAMKIGGGCYLLWVAFRALRAAWLGQGARLDAVGRGADAARNWRFGAAVVLTNPKAALMWAAAAGFLFGQGVPALGVLAFGPLAATSAVLVYGGYAVLFSTGPTMRLYQRAARAVDACFGAAFGAMGGALLAEVMRKGQG